MYTVIDGNLLLYAGLGYHKQVIGQPFLNEAWSGPFQDWTRLKTA